MDSLRRLTQRIDECVREFRELRARIGSVENPPRPQTSAQGGQGVGEGGRAVGRVPRSRLPGRLRAVAGDVLEPDGRVGPEREGGRPLRSLVLPRLGVLAAQELA